MLHKRFIFLLGLFIVISLTVPVLASTAAKGEEDGAQVIFNGDTYSVDAFVDTVGDVTAFYTLYKDNTWYVFKAEADRDAFFAELVAQNADVLAAVAKQDSAVQFTVFYDNPYYGGFAAHVYNGNRYCGSQLGSLDNRASSAVSYTSWYTKMWSGNCSGTSHVLWSGSQIPHMGSTPIGDNNMSGVRTCPYTTPVNQCN